MKLQLACALLASVLALSYSDAAKPSPRERVTVQEVFAAGDEEFVVMLRSQSKPFRYLPIFVGEMEAVMIRMRLDRRTPPRPWTLNLLESVLDAGKIKIADIAIDDIKSGVFLGRIKLRSGAKVWELDARPSDVIGLALGQRAPLWVSREIMDDAAVSADDLKDSEEEEDEAPTNTRESPKREHIKDGYRESL